MSFDLLVAPGSFELRNQVGGTDHIFPQPAQQLDGPAIDQRNREDDVVGRILHGDVAVGCEHRLQGVEKFLPSGILALAAGQGIEVAGFDFVDQFYRFTLRGNQIEPAPRDHETCGQAKHSVGDGIAMMVVVEQPRVDVAFAQRRLDGSQVHGQTPIVNNGKDLGESVRREIRAAFTALSFLNTNKYPPSLRPALIVGKVPMFYYLLHIPLIHVLAIAVCYARYGQVQWMFESPGLGQFPITPPPGWGYSLPIVYLFWALVVLTLYPLCRRFARLKQRRSDAGLSYF